MVTSSNDNDDDEDDKYVVEVRPQGWMVASTNENKDYDITNMFTLVNFVYRKWGMDENGMIMDEVEVRPQGWMVALTNENEDYEVE